MKSYAEAPAKSIVTGEHFVVHGAWALAAALPVRVRVQVVPSSKFEVRSDRFEREPADAFRPVSEVIEAAARTYSSDPRVAISISSDIPHGAGLGSSAATMVAVAAAFCRLRSLPVGPKEVAELAMAGERYVHGSPSGIDPTVSALGGVILFRPGSPPRRVKLDGTRTLIVSYSGESRSTRHQISRVAETKEKYPDYFGRLAESVSEVSLEAASMLSKGDMNGLGRLLTLNHAVLSSLGVSDAILDGMVQELTGLGSYGAKLTGAGGGGSVLAVSPRGKEKSIVSGLRARGFETFVAKVPVGGVRSWLER